MKNGIGEIEHKNKLSRHSLKLGSSVFLGLALFGLYFMLNKAGIL